MNNNDCFIAFVGNPNCGKSTVFNALTGLRQKIANFPGVTIEPKIGVYKDSEHNLRLIDLPGFYSFSPKTPDEELSVAVLQGRHESIEKPNAALFVMEGTNLEKGLFLYSQFSALGIPTVVLVTMIDGIKARGGAFDDIALERELGVPVIGIVGHKGIGLEETKEFLQNPSRFVVPKSVAVATGDIEARYAWARATANRTANIPATDPLTKKLDAVFLHRFFAPFIFGAVMLVFFQSIFTWAEPLMDGVGSLISFLQSGIEQSIPAGIFQNFLTKGVLAGVGTVVTFLPQILILYLFITLLEDFGYLSRAAFIVDRIMGVFGLQGRSFIPILGSFACAIPGIMSARIIPSEKDRIATIMVAPLMPCSARLPVYVLLISAFVPSTMIFGIFNTRGLVLAGLYALGAISGLVIAKIFKTTMFRGDKLPFLMELPPYRFPSLRSVGITMLNRSKEFLKNAGTTILFLSIALWALSEFPQSTPAEGTPKLEQERIQLEQSALGQIGKAIQPAFAPIGFDWKITVGVLGSFAAREVFVSVMGQMYSQDVSESNDTLRDVLQKSIPLPVALSILVFYVYALQCISTLVVMKRETHSWKYPAIAFTYSLALAYGAAFTVFSIARL